MPTVPRYTGEVRERGIPKIRAGIHDVPLETFGGGEVAARPLEEGQRIAGDVQKMALQAQEDADDLAKLEMQRQVSQAELDLRRARNNYMGKDSLEYGEEAKKTLTTLKEDLSKRAANATQKSALEQMMLKAEVSTSSVVESHVSREMEKFKAQEFQAFLENKTESATSRVEEIEEQFDLLIGMGILHPEEDKDKINKLRSDVYKSDLEADSKEYRDALEKRATSLGLGAEAKKRFKMEQMTRYHLSIAQTMMDNEQGEQAEKYLAANKGEILTKAMDAVEENVKTARIRGDAQSEADHIMAQNLTMQESLAKAREIKDPKVRDATVNRINARFREKENAKREIQDALFMDLWNSLDKPSDFEKIKGSQFESLTSAQQRSLEARRDQLIKNQEPKTDYNVWLRFIDMPTEQLAKKTKAEMLTLQQYLDPNAYSNALSMWQAAKTHMERAKAATARAAVKEAERTEKEMVAAKQISDSKRIDKFMIQRGLIPVNKDKISDQQAEVAFRFKNKVQSNLEAAGKKLSGPDVDRVIMQTYLEMKSTPVWQDDSFSWYKYGIFATNPITGPIAPFISGTTAKADLITIETDKHGKAYTPWALIPDPKNSPMSRSSIANNIRASFAERGIKLTDGEVQRRTELYYAAKMLGYDIKAMSIRAGIEVE